MKKTFYLITEKNYNNNNKLDVGTFIEKIILSTDTEDFKEFSKESFGETLKRCLITMKIFFGLTLMIC